jgi:hypothetical protein
MLAARLLARGERSLGYRRTAFTGTPILRYHPRLSVYQIRAAPTASAFTPSSASRTVT